MFNNLLVTNVNISRKAWWYLQ